MDLRVDVEAKDDRRPSFQRELDLVDSNGPSSAERQSLLGTQCTSDPDHSETRRTLIETQHR